MSTLALCIPAYNAVAYLPRLLQSARNQMIPFDEILVYNDASTDDTAQIAEQYGAKVVNGIENKGCSFGKNTLAELTKCDWVHFHDADDDLLPDFTQQAHNWIDSNGNEYDVLVLNFNYADFETGRVLGTANHNATELHADALKYAISHKIVNFGVYKHNSFISAGGFDLDENVLYNEDNAFHQRLAKFGLKFDYLPEITCINYRYNKSMSVSNQLKCTRANYHVIEKTISTHGDKYPAELALQMWICVTNLATAQDWAYVKKAVKYCENLGYKYPAIGPSAYRFLTHVNPFFGVWMREKLIRLFKPELRKSAI